MENSTALITDSTCDIPPAYDRPVWNHSHPASCGLGEELFRDRVDLTPEDFYQRLENDPVWPTSTLPSPFRF